MGQIAFAVQKQGIVDNGWEDRVRKQNFLSRIAQKFAGSSAETVMIELDSAEILAVEMEQQREIKRPTHDGMLGMDEILCEADMSGLTTVYTTLGQIKSTDAAEDIAHQISNTAYFERDDGYHKVRVNRLAVNLDTLVAHESDVYAYYFTRDGDVSSRMRIGFTAVFHDAKALGERVSFAGMFEDNPMSKMLKTGQIIDITDSNLQKTIIVCPEYMNLYFNAKELGEDTYPRFPLSFSDFAGNESEIRDHIKAARQKRADNAPNVSPR